MILRKSNIAGMESIIKKRSYDFALMCLKAGMKIQKDEREFLLSKQFIKSATSIGANICEANSGESLKDFLHKMKIALKEASETRYWCSLLLDLGLLNSENDKKLLEESDAICKILGKIISTTQKKIGAMSKG